MNQKDTLPRPKEKEKRESEGRRVDDEDAEGE